MKIRLIEEKDGDYTFYKVQYWTLLGGGWLTVNRANSVTLDKEKAEELYSEISVTKNVCRGLTKVLHQATTL